MSKEERKDIETINDETQTARFRIGGRIVLVMVFLSLTVFMGYLIRVQFKLQHDRYEEFSYKASQMHWQRIKDVPSRGDILDRNGNILASTTYEYTIGITPSDVMKSQEGRKDALTSEDIAEAFSEIIGADKQKMVESLAKTETPYIQVMKKVTYDQKNELQAYLTEHNIGGVKIDSVPKRYYNYGSLGAQVIGFADQNDNSLIGQYGIEAYYNSYLTGTEGYTYAEVDNYNQSALPYSAPTSISAQDGYNVQLTLDMNIQRIAENACRDAYNEYKPREGVTCIIMDPYTGEILAMVSMPDFDLNTPRQKPYGISDSKWEEMSSEDQAKYLMRNAWRNRCISDTYEPGSTMKAVTTAIALEEGLTYEDEIFSDSPIEVSSVDTIRCWREKTEGNHGDETLREAFERSCNPIFVRLAYRIKIDRYYNYIHNCGFYDVTGVDLPAEGKGIFHAEPTDVDLASLSFGESSTVTPLQLISVYSSLVNGGSLMRPRVASRIVDNNGNIIKEFEPEKVRTLFSEKTSARVRSLLEDVVNEGTGAAGYVPGYYVAGKTSTSTIDVGDEAGMHVLSFGCYAPSYDPKIAVLVVINKPEDNDIGSSAAAKVSARIVEETLEYMNVDRKLSDKEYERMTILYHVPDVTGKTFLQAKIILEEEGYEVLDGSGTMDLDTIVGTMYYGGEETVYKDTVIVLYPGEVGETEMNTTLIPDFTGMSIIECRRMAKEYGLNIVVDGNIKGRVVEQDPPSSIRSAKDPTATPTPTPDPDAPPPDETGEDPGEDPGEETTGEPPETTAPEGEDPDTGETTEETKAPPPTDVPYGAIIHVKME
ncbi:MAG: peptidoglycan glycosyltransferase [Clostridiales bacterium]|nr:peptidoglycan glycosyltransferase [Clostridiales bacterium]